LSGYWLLPSYCGVEKEYTEHFLEGVLCALMPHGSALLFFA
jgi:hypothetical protein